MFLEVSIGAQEAPGDVVSSICPKKCLKPDQKIFSEEIQQKDFC